MLTLLLFCALLAAYRWGMRPSVVTVVFIAAPAVLVWNAPRLDLQVFTWVKVLTLAVSMLLIVNYPMARTEAGRRRLAQAVAAIVALNILEAVVADGVAGHWANALVGLSLIATMAGPGAFSRQASSGNGSGSGSGHMHCDAGWPWVLCYSAWNLTVVLGVYPEHWADHLAVLAVPLAAAWIWGRERWLEARAFSLSVYAVGIVLAIDVFHLPWIPASPKPDAVYPWLSGLAVALALWNAAPTLARLRRPRAAA